MISALIKVLVTVFVVVPVKLFVVVPAKAFAALASIGGSVIGLLGKLFAVGVKVALLPLKLVRLPFKVMR